MKLYLYGCIACLALPLLADTAPLPLGAGVRTADPSAHVWPVLFHHAGAEPRLSLLHVDLTNRPLAVSRDFYATRW